MPNTIETALRDFIDENFLFRRDDAQLTLDASLLQSGLIDSTGVLELVGFLGERFGIEVEDDDLVETNLDTLRGLIAFIERKLGRAASQTTTSPRLAQTTAE